MTSALRRGPACLGAHRDRRRARWRVAANGGRGLRYAEQLREQRAVRGRIPVVRGDDLLADHAVAADDERLGNARGLVIALDVTGRILEDLERQPVLVAELS